MAKEDRLMPPLATRHQERFEVATTFNLMYKSRFQNHGIGNICYLKFIKTEELGFLYLVHCNGLDIKYIHLVGASGVCRQRFDDGPLA
jgi:hypothetical protein